MRSPPVRTLDALVVNTCNGYRTRVVKSEAEGLHDLKQLIDTTRFEEAWAYNPESKVWFEIGTHETHSINTQGSFQAGAYIDSRWIQDSLPQSGTIYAVHIHPATRSEQEKDTERRLAAMGVTPNHPEYRLIAFNLSSMYQVLKATPSEGDIETMVHSSIKNKNNGVKVIYRVVSEFGALDFASTPKGTELFASQLNPAISQYGLEVRLRIERFLAEQAKTGVFLRTPPEQILQDASREASDERITISFTPYSRLRKP